MTDDNIIHNTGDQHIFGERFEDYHMPNDQVVKVSDAPFTALKRYIGANVGTIYLQDGSEVTVILGKGSKIHIINEENEDADNE